MLKRDTFVRLLNFIPYIYIIKWINVNEDKHYKDKEIGIYILLYAQRDTDNVSYSLLWKSADFFAVLTSLQEKFSIASPALQMRKWI